jgi:hypothetical protein
MDKLNPATRDYLRALQQILAQAPAGAPVDHALASLVGVLDGADLDIDRETSYLYDRLEELQADSGRIPLPSGADIPDRMRADYQRPAYDQNEHDELAWCIECGQVCGHAGHRHAQGDQGTTVCEQCGVTLDPLT